MALFLRGTSTTYKDPRNQCILRRKPRNRKTFLAQYSAMQNQFQKWVKKKPSTSANTLLLPFQDTEAFHLNFSLF